MSTLPPNGYMVGSQRGRPVEAVLSKAILERKCLPFNEACLQQASDESGNLGQVILTGGRAEDTDDGQAPPSPHAPRRPAECDDIPSPHSITSSERACKFGGMSKPKAFAVFKLITSSNVAGCII